MRLLAVTSTHWAVLLCIVCVIIGYVLAQLEAFIRDNPIK